MAQKCLQFAQFDLVQASHLRSRTLAVASASNEPLAEIRDDRQVGLSARFAARIWSIVRAGSAQPASPTTLAGTPATVFLGGTGRKHHGARRDPRAMANLDIAEDLGAGADQHAVPDFRMPVADLLAGAAQGHVLKHRNIVFDHRRRADDKAGRVIEKYAFADPRRRMNVGLERPPTNGSADRARNPAARSSTAHARGDASRSHGSP